MCERNSDHLPLVCAPTRDGSCNPGMCPDWELDQRPFDLQDDAQPTEPYQPRLLSSSLNGFQVSEATFLWVAKAPILRTCQGVSGISVSWAHC